MWVVSWGVDGAAVLGSDGTARWKLLCEARGKGGGIQDSGVWVGGGGCCWFVSWWREGGGREMGTEVEGTKEMESEDGKVSHSASERPVAAVVSRSLPYLLK